jgi:imidazolonepropionase-like amidohydrolase
MAAVLLGGCAAPGGGPAAAAPTETLAPASPIPSATAAPTATPAPPTATLTPPTLTSVPPTATPAPPTATALPRYDLVLSGGMLIDGTGGAPMPDAAVAISGGRIAAVGRASELAYSSDTPVHELAGATILPGFINAHAHTVNLSDNELRAWVRAGVTTVRDLGGPLASGVARRDRIAGGGDQSLPRLLIAGPIVNVLGSFSTEIYGVNDRVLVVNGPADARAKTLGLLDGGADLVKLAVSGRTDVRYAELSNAELAAITAAAAERGAHVAAHVDRAVALRRAVENGVSSVAHSPRDRIPDSLIALMVERGVGMAPTIAVYEGLARERGNLAEWRRLTQPVLYDNLRRFAAAGGLLALGDDYGGAEGMTVGMPAEEIGHWLAAGLSPMQVIVAATSGSAQVAGLDDELGTVAPGLAADLLVVDGDPLEDIDALVRPLLVVHGGEVVWGAKLKGAQAGSGLSAFGGMIAQRRR